MIAYVFLALSVVAFFLIWYRRGPAPAAFMAVVLGAGLPVLDLASIGDSSALTALADPSITLTSCSMAVLGGILALPSQTFRGIPISFLLFIVSLALLTLAQGVFATHTASGILHWTTALFSWGIGAAIWSAVLDVRSFNRVVACVSLVVVGWHGLFVAMQLAGIRAVASVEAGATDIARVSGAAGHSGNLGKIMILIIMILLPLTRSRDKVTARISLSAVVFAASMTALTFSRANIVGIGILLGIWIVAGPGVRFTHRFAVGAVVLLVSVPVIDVLLLRSEYDPDGGSRPRLLATAVSQIAETLIVGVGPNNYLEIVGQYDALAAGGLPVHSALLLTLAEVGLVCSIFLLVPIVGLLARSLRSVRGTAEGSTYALALLAATPGILLIAGTGWGILRGQFLVLLFFSLGYMYAAQMAASKRDSMLPASTFASADTQPR